MQEKIRPGYKQTEVGLVPEDWGVALARDVLIINRGRVISHRELAKHPGPYPVYSSQTKDNGVMGYLNTYAFEGEFLTWTTDGANAGTVFYRNGKFNCTNVCGAGKARIASQTSAAFYAYFLDTVAWKHVSHVGNPKLMSGPFGSIPVVVPPPAEQRAIAEALSDADARIAALEALIAKKRDLKQAAMQQLLTGKTRLPGFSGEWEMKRLGDHVRFLKNGTLSRAQLAIYAAVKYLHYGDIHGSVSLWLDPRSVGMPCVDPELVASLDRLADGDLIFADASEDLDGVGKSIEIANCTETEVVSGLHTIAARFDKEVLADGFKAYLQFMPPFRAHLRSMAAGTKVLATNRKHIGSATLALPEPPEQIAIAEVLSDMDADIAALDAEAEKARTIKQGMMQNLLTGKVRLV